VNFSALLKALAKSICPRRADSSLFYHYYCHHPKNTITMFAPFANSSDPDIDARVAARNRRASMPPPTGDAAQNTDSKSSSGLASVFKSLTGGKPSKSPSTQSPASTLQQLENRISAQRSNSAGAINQQHAIAQLKDGQSPAERVRAAEYLRQAVIDYPMSNVSLVYPI
jgi:hypothetical protein